MHVITVANIKGGAGKTSLSVTLAWWAARSARQKDEGQRVVLLDLDDVSPSATQWHSAAELNSFEARRVTRNEISDLVARYRAEGDVATLIIDTPAREESAIITACGEADLVLIPFRSGSGDVAQVVQTLPLLNLPRRANPNLQAIAVMVATGDALTVDRETRALVEQFGVPVARAQIPNLKIYTTAKGSPITIKSRHYEDLWKELQGELG